MRVAVIDDEYPSRSELRYFITQYLPETIVDEADSAQKAIELFSGSVSYHAAFIDIHLGDMTGTSLSTILKAKQPRVQIVFATAYDAYAVKAFDMNAVDYVMKPFDPKRIAHCLKKLTGEEPLPCVQAFTGKLTVAADKKVVVLNIRDIAYIESKERHCMIHTLAGECVSTLPLNHYECKLVKDQFFRIHKSFLVNLQFVCELAPWVNGAFHVKLKGFEERNLPVSRKQVKALKDILEI